MSELVPLFPLPNVVLLPRAVILLHIFEERYKAMTADVLSSDGRLALATLRSGWEKSYYGTPPIESVICVGRIVRHEQLDDGTYNFLLQGQDRVRVVREERVGLYRAAEVESVEDTGVLEIDLQHERKRLLKLFDGQLAAHPLSNQFAEVIRKDLMSTRDAGDFIAYHLLSDPVEKQLMLQEPNARVRLARLLEQLDRLAASLGPSAQYLGRPLGLN